MRIGDGLIRIVMNKHIIEVFASVVKNDLSGDKYEQSQPLCDRGQHVNV